jgi:two-component system chemotaxis response regulator CheY
LLDLVLPDMSGSAIYPLIREHRPFAKVIICSGYGLAGPTQELLDAGADSFIQKPYGLTDLHEIILKVMSSGKDTLKESML